MLQRHKAEHSGRLLPSFAGDDDRRGGRSSSLSPSVKRTLLVMLALSLVLLFLIFGPSSPASSTFFSAPSSSPRLSGAVSLPKQLLTSPSPSSSKPSSLPSSPSFPSSLQLREDDDEDKPAAFQKYLTSSLEEALPTPYSALEPTQLPNPWAEVGVPLPLPLRPTIDKLFFIHVPKTAGFTVKKYLNFFLAKTGFLMPDVSADKMPISSKVQPLEPGSRSPNGGLRCSTYCRCAEGLSMVKAEPAKVPRCDVLSGHVDWSTLQYINDILQSNGNNGNAIVMTTLREPIKRVVSEYNFIVTKRRAHPVTKQGMDLATYIHTYLPNKGLHNLQTLIMAGATNGTSNYHQDVLDLITKDRTTLLETAKRNLLRTHHFGLIERWDDSLELMRFTFGWDNDTSILSALKQQQTEDKQKQLANGGEAGEAAPIELRSVHVSAPYEKPSEEMLEAIRKYNDMDVELYEFASWLFEQRFQYMRSVKQKLGWKDNELTSSVIKFVTPPPVNIPHTLPRSAPKTKQLTRRAEWEEGEENPEE
ncbi:hypothetical protein QOT17_008273 [Balamuthia mandrillaris]